MGENILIVHGGGPTSVINASLYGAVKEAKKYKEIEHIYAAKNGTGGLMREELIELENVPDEKLELLLNTPGPKKAARSRVLFPKKRSFTS